MTPAPPHAFHLMLSVQPEDIDALGHVNNVVYLRWVQEVAGAHWFAVAPPEEQAALVWVVRRHEIDYQAPALPGEAIRLSTWVGAAEGITFERFTEIARVADGKVLARARTLWCPLNARTGRPVRVTPELRAQFSVRE